MLPLNDLNPRRRFPFFTFGLIAINVLIFLWELSLTPEELQSAFAQYSVVPALLTADIFSIEALLDLLRSMFFHGSWSHLLGNMLYLYLFGDNVEDRFGFVIYLGVYFSSGMMAAFAQVVIDPDSTIPLVGASGAIAGILGAYLVLYPRVRVRGIIPLGYFIRSVEWPAWGVLLLWFGVQLLQGVGSLGVESGGGVAFFAHIGGFVFGAAFGWILMKLFPQPAAPQREEMLYERAQQYRY